MSDPKAAPASTQSSTAASNPQDKQQQQTSSSSSSTSSGAAPQPAKQFTGYHSFMVNACKFTVDAKYQPLKPLGRGAYGVVWWVKEELKLEVKRSEAERRGEEAVRMRHNKQFETTALSCSSSLHIRANTLNVYALVPFRCFYFQFSDR